jgi:hypothetical protein
VDDAEQLSASEMEAACCGRLDCTNRLVEASIILDSRVLDRIILG